MNFDQVTKETAHFLINLKLTMNFNSLAKQTIYKGHRAWCYEQKQALIQLLIDSGEPKFIKTRKLITGEHMRVIIFEIDGWGRVSFHTPHKLKGIIRFRGDDPETTKDIYGKLSSFEHYWNKKRRVAA